MTLSERTWRAAVGQLHNKAAWRWTIGGVEYIHSQDYPPKNHVPTFSYMYWEDVACSNVPLFATTVQRVSAATNTPFGADQYVSDALLPTGMSQLAMCRDTPMTDFKKLLHKLETGPLASASIIPPRSRAKRLTITSLPGRNLGYFHFVSYRITNAGFSDSSPSFASIVIDCRAMYDSPVLYTASRYSLV